MQHSNGQVGRPPKADRDTLLRVAWQVFEEIGFDAATMTVIAERAGVSRRTLFNHFPHKVALLYPDTSAFMDAFRAEVLRQPPGLKPIATFTNAFWALGPVIAEMELRYAPGPEVARARLREDAIGYWKSVWQGKLEQMTLDMLGPDSRMAAGFVGAIAAQIWVEFAALQHRDAVPMRASEALRIVFDELARVMGTDPR